MKNRSCSELQRAAADGDKPVRTSGRTLGVCEGNMSCSPWAWLAPVAPMLGDGGSRAPRAVSTGTHSMVNAQLEPRGIQFGHDRLADGQTGHLRPGELGDASRRDEQVVATRRVALANQPACELARIDPGGAAAGPSGELSRRDPRRDGEDPVRPPASVVRDAGASISRRLADASRRAVRRRRRRASW
jgi:hypothetical protein